MHRQTPTFCVSCHLVRAHTVARSAQWNKRTFRQGIFNCTESQWCKAQRLQPEAGRAEVEAERWGGVRFLGEGHWVPPCQLRSLGSAVSSPSRVRGRAKTAQWFFTVLGTEKCLSWTKSAIEHLLIDNTRRFTWPKTRHCIVRFGRKIMTGHLPKKPDSLVKNRTPVNLKAPVLEGWPRCACKIYFGDVKKTFLVFWMHFIYFMQQAWSRFQT